MDLGHWTLRGVTIDEGNLPYGFIYVITNTVLGKQYIGKKQMKTIKKLKPLKGKKNKRHFEVETDWKEYTSSSNDVNEDIKKYGKDKFCFEIVRLCQSKFELAYYEAKMQFDNEVLLREGFYNGIINCRIGRAPNELLQRVVEEKQKAAIIVADEKCKDTS